MDLILGNFVKKYINNLNYEELIYLYEILEKDDDVLLKWYSSDAKTKDFPKNKVTKLLKNFKLD